VNSIHGKDYKGLFVELQYRTYVQHAWATAVEVIGVITESQPKFQRGDVRFERIMVLASEILARAFEDSFGCLRDRSNEEVLQEFIALDGEIGLLKMLRGLNAADKDVSTKRNVILMFSENEALEVKSYRDATDALRALFELERQHPGMDVVLVRADTSDEVRIAFRNYFSDAKEFISLIMEGCQKLSPAFVIIDSDALLSDAPELS
jgi:putative GTP pyrophosphokinase